MSITQTLNESLRKWGNIVGMSIGIGIIVVTIVLQAMGVNYYEFYDTRGYDSVIRVPIFTNYFLGGLFVLLSFKRKWLSVHKKMGKGYC